MTQATQNQTQTQTTERQRAFPLSGTLTEVESKIDKVGKPYLSAKFNTTIKKKPVTVRAMACGKAAEAVKGIFIEGEARLFGLFEKPNGESKCGAFRVIAPGLPPKAAAAA